MTKINFTDENYHPEKLYPFGRIQSVLDLRVGILTIREKWEKILNHPAAPSFSENDLLKIPVNLVPSRALLNEPGFPGIDYSKPGEHFRLLEKAIQLFEYNEWAIRNDFELITGGRTSDKISETNNIISPHHIFIEEGAVIEHCTLNASTGPIYIGTNAVVMEGTCIRGPFAACEGATVKMGTRIYGSSTIGPHCIAGGEIKNSILMAYSNKAHDGYLGDSVIGEWCNLGAGTSNSNIKNTAGIIKVWNNFSGEFENAGIKCGLIMGDYSRCAINTSFNTGTVTGICCNIFGNGVPEKHLPDFSWGDERYTLQRALKHVDNWKKLKGHAISDNDIEQLTAIYSSKKSNHA